DLHRHAQGRRRLPLADEQFRGVDLDRPPVQGAPRRLRGRLRLHALRAGGFSRGAAPDNLVFLPTPQERGTQGGLRRDADVCPDCGDTALVRKGADLICDTCGVRAEGDLTG
ncbi:MAG: hypothetical protein ACOYKF_02780, partial [Phenylobacterium sp.]